MTYSRDHREVLDYVGHYFILAGRGCKVVFTFAPRNSAERKYRLTIQPSTIPIDACLGGNSGHQAGGWVR